MESTICLNMVAKESLSAGSLLSVKASLESVRELLDYWVIAVDGNDQTITPVIEAALDGIPGETVEVETHHISECRNTLLDYSRDKADYILVLDQNMRIRVGQEADSTHLTADGYFIELAGDIRRFELRLLSTEKEWAYHGVACENVFSTEQQLATQKLEGFSIVSLIESGLLERQNEQVQQLAAWLTREPEDGHARFNLARLQMFTNDYISALDNFNLFLDGEKHWDEEWRWYAQYHRAKLMEALEYERADLLEAYHQAYEQRPIRAEPLFEIARIHRESGQFARAHIYAQQALQTRLPESETYDLETEVYQWHIPAESATVCAKLGDREGAIMAANEAIYRQSKNRQRLRSMIDLRDRMADQLVVNGRDSGVHNHENAIRVIVPFRNARPYLGRCISSLQNQSYFRFTATFIDDCSSDESHLLVPLEDKRFELIRNQERVGPLVNRMKVIEQCDPDDIVVYLDGDDQLASDDVLAFINEFYNQHDCWLSYGQYLSQNGHLGNARPYVSQQHLIDELEGGTMRFPMHPITHRAGLFQRIKEFDPELSCFKDENGDWLFYASDAVLARPLFYLAGHRRIRYCSRVLYLYTEGHEISESIHNKQDQLDACAAAGSRLRPPRVEDYRPPC